ncbi:MAG: 4Fe-4S dicluster domain-containing protein [Corynebacterium glucuronolyticum]|nr:4Fe-4S dicluster domain-containing protein [Mycobacteriaceae bacterium]MDY5834384.1 4Fe-4S dicluster domain-containing protein [Corynebacterium glucuronolyticum]
MDSSTRRRLFSWIQDEAPTLVLTADPHARYPRDVVALLDFCHPAELLAVGASAVYTDGFDLPPATRWTGPSGDTPPISQPPISRRSLFALRRDLPVDPTAPDHERLYQANQILGLPTELHGLTAEGCIACGVCTKVCPESALYLHLNGDDVALYHDRTRCTGHTVCVDVCPYDALRPATPDTAEVVPLVTGTLTTCKKCHTRFIASAPADTLCPTCAHQQQDPFGSWFPS